LVATIDKNGDIDEIQDGFSTYEDEIRKYSNDNVADLAKELVDYAVGYQISPTASGVTDGNGILNFTTDVNGDKLKQGLYLVRGDNSYYDAYYCIPVPFMTLLPRYDMVEDEAAWIYDVKSQPKDDFIPVNTPPGEGGEPTGYDDDIAVYDDEYGIVDTPGIATLSGDVETGSVDNPEPLPTLSGSLPQTGQLWWPIPILVAVGLVLIIIGIIRRRNFEYEE
jgi:hypothetical protein